MTEKEKIEAREAEARDLRNRLVAEYHELTSRIVCDEALMHTVFANRYASRHETNINEELAEQVGYMKSYRYHLMRRMAMLGIDLKAVVN